MRAFVRLKKTEQFSPLESFWFLPFLRFLYDCHSAILSILLTMKSISHVFRLQVIGALRSASTFATKETIEGNHQHAVEDYAKHTSASSCRFITGLAVRRMERHE